MPPVSNNAADRAAIQIREYFAVPPSERAPMRRLAIDALAVILDYRDLHTRPMTSVTMGIRSMVKTVRGDDSIRPGQRFKRMDRIIDKLRRFPHMRLSQMEDIGGCRVILPTIDEVYAVLARIRHNWPEAKVDDAIRNPHSDGYRGIHIVKRRAVKTTHSRYFRSDELVPFAS